MKIAILLGSIRVGRQTHKIAYYVQQKLQERGIDTVMIDLASQPLPFMEERSHHQRPQTGQIASMGTQLKTADAILLVSPEYHGSFTGVLKNALDYYWSEFARKPMGVIATGSGRMGGINASTQLQHVILSLGAYALPFKLLIPEIQHAFDENMQPLREDVVKNTTRFLDEFLWFANAIVQYRMANQQS
ncbi:MAG TPA: NADPH-dependent FMN reductase [Chitinophagaceae bacterium]|nr:NADPH-dependent FMN reductase [Chitinophagaceae bacterium]